MAYRSDAARVLQRRHSTGGSENGQTGSRGGEYLIEPTFSISRSASGLTRKKAHCIESRQGTDAMPSQMSERSDLAEQIARCRRLANAITDQATVQLLLAMAIEYELRLNSISQRPLG